MAETTKDAGGYRVIGTIVQIIAGLILGPMAVAALLRWLPLESGVGVVAVSVVITLGLAGVVVARRRVARPGAIAFAVSATLINLVVALVVVGS